jgi:hypothetical protein
VNAVLIELVKGRDHKLYPARPLTDAQRARAAGLAHALICRDGLSVRQAQQIMRESYALRRAVGTIARDLRVFRCPRCPQPDPGPAQAQPGPDRTHQGSPGGLARQRNLDEIGLPGQGRLTDGLPGQ